jgi:hypothetical protein
MPITRIAISAQRFAQWHAQISIDLQQALEDIFRSRRRLFSAF